MRGKLWAWQRSFIALVVGRFGEFFRYFAKLRDYIYRQRACAYNEHFNSSINRAMSMFKLSITPRWALMAAHGWAPAEAELPAVIVGGVAAVIRDLIVTLTPPLLQLLSFS